MSHMSCEFLKPAMNLNTFQHAVRCSVTVFLVLVFITTATIGKEIAEGNTSISPDAFTQAAASGRIAGYSLSKVQRWLQEVALKQIDPKTGLYVARGEWNYRNTAADCYPFVCWAAYVTDEKAFQGPMRDILHAEIKLCNHLDRIPVPYDFQKGTKKKQPYDVTIFGASEYVKDGLIPIVEVTGKEEWFDRMVAIEDDLWRHARLETPYGKIPSIPNSVKGIEIDGEQLQALARLYAMTGEQKYLTWARRLGDYYLKRDDFLPPQLRDHGCEIIGGLGLLLAVESEIGSDKLQEYLPPFKKMLDTILARGCTDDGFMYNMLDGKALAPFPEGSLSDGWGYNYVSYLCHDMIVGRPDYQPKVQRTLRNLLKPASQAIGSKGDSLADSTEGAMYLLNRCPVPEGKQWLDREIADHLVFDKVPLEKAKLWGVNKWESNCVRTTIMHALMHTQGVIARPWRRDLELGACPEGDALAIVLKAEEAYEGRLVFDIPRHRIYLGFQRDWPRMNTLPEWFTVEPEKEYTITNLTDNTTKTMTGQELHDGLRVRVKPGQTLRLSVQPYENPHVSHLNREGEKR